SALAWRGTPVRHRDGSLPRKKCSTPGSGSAGSGAAAEAPSTDQRTPTGTSISPPGVKTAPSAPSAPSGRSGAGVTAGRKAIEGPVGTTPRGSATDSVEAAAASGARRPSTSAPTPISTANAATTAKRQRTG